MGADGARGQAAGRRRQGDRGAGTRHEGGVRRALYAGDDRTDVDAFAGLDGLELGIRVAVDSREAPAELREAADLVVDGPEGVLELLRGL